MQCHIEQKKCKKAAQCKTKLKKQAQKKKKSKKAAKKSQDKSPLSTLEKASHETGKFATQNGHNANAPSGTQVLVESTNHLGQDLKSGPALWKYMNDEELSIGRVFELVLIHLTDKDTTTIAEGIDRIRRASCGALE